MQFKKTLAASAAMLGLVLTCAGSVRAQLIVGPSAFPNHGTNAFWGIQFKALNASKLTGFDYHHQANTQFTGTITLKDITTNTTVYTSAYGVHPAAVIAYTGLNILLASGDDYQLTATSTIISGARDEVFQYVVLNSPPMSYPVADAHIRVTNGAFDDTSTFAKTNMWGAFGNITTAAAVPEPGTYAFMGTAGIGLLAALRRKRK